MMTLVDRSDIAAQLAHIRAIVRLEGEICVGCDELYLLSPGAMNFKALLTAVMEIAQWEHWEVEFLADGRVRFFA